ncbi:Cysteine-rich secretory protein family protein [Pricia antarctica]|uniref:Cysteine-rich secretory protein family protein n=1 Tax=Pricia antarctica TaxID=641691 RepID=A0A1G6Y188_9FLAO|nr:CAP domain-containing protein [Pricia antarctica]SDD83386.1 Cysteine-rich secretory protein family protein [Pricia antarctica]
MRLPQLSYILVSVVLLSVSCSKDSNKDPDNSHTDGPGTENPVTGKQETDKADRAIAKQLYADFYYASRDTGTEVSWTGNEPNCQPGTVPQDTKDKIFQRLLYFRKAVGLTNAIAENRLKSEKAQHAALMMHANGTLSHDPPNEWKCFSEDGKEAAQNSVLTSTRNAGAIDSYMQDQGKDNYPVGHRRYLLWSRLQEIGVGNTSSYNAIWVIGNPGERPADTPEFIAWPPKGYLPKQLAYPRWSFSIAKADFTQTTISMKTATGENVNLETEKLKDGFGDETIVWKPSIDTNSLIEDSRFVVSLKNVGVDGETKNFEYEVVLFDVNE